MRMLLLTTLMIFVSSASAGLYKWVDDEGNVHYSQKRPINKQFERLKAPAPSPDGSKPLYNSIKQNKNKGGASPLKLQNSKNFVRIIVKGLKKNLESYTLYRRFRDKDGNITRVDDKERAKQIAEAKQAINEFCK